MSLVDAEYANSDHNRPRFSVRSMLLALIFMHFEGVPSLGSFAGNSRYTTMQGRFASLEIKRAKPENTENLSVHFLEDKCLRAYIDNVAFGIK